MPKGTCSFDNCGRYDNHLRRGLCHNCYERMRRANRLNEFAARPKKVPTYERAVKIGWEAQPNGCWHWQGTLNAYGYGTIFNGTYGKNRSPRRSIVTRVVWAYHNGDIPDGYVICHTCDNPKCVNPKHLFAAPPKINTHDMLAKRRNPNGERHPNFKLTDVEVAQIRLEYEGKRGDLARLGRKYGVSRSCILAIVKARSRRTLTNPELA